MSTRLLYHEDDGLRTFAATVVAVDEAARTVQLDATAFYPTGGHQRCDQGRIERDRKAYVIVTDVHQGEDGVVLHRWVGGRGQLRPGDRVQGAIDPDRRLQHTRLHTAQHLFSRCAQQRFGTSTGRADFGPDGGLVVVQPALTWLQAVLLEDDVNRHIRADRSVTRRREASGKTWIAIDGVDESPCGGTHVRSTAQIALFKVVRLAGHTIAYEVAERAQRAATHLANQALEAADRLGLASPRELLAAIAGLQQARAQAAERLDEWRREIVASQVARARGGARRLGASGPVLLQLELAALTAKEARELLEGELTGPGEVWLCLAHGRSFLVSTTTPGLSARDVARQAAERWGIRGGGGQRFAQAGPVPDGVVAPLAEAARWLEALAPARDRNGTEGGRR